MSDFTSDASTYHIKNDIHEMLYITKFFNKPTKKLLLNIKKYKLLSMLNNKLPCLGNYNYNSLKNNEILQESYYLTNSFEKINFDNNNYFYVVLTNLYIKIKNKKYLIVKFGFTTKFLKRLKDLNNHHYIKNGKKYKIQHYILSLKKVSCINIELEFHKNIQSLYPHLHIPVKKTEKPIKNKCYQEYYIMADEIIAMFNNVENMDIEVIREKTKQKEIDTKQMEIENQTKQKELDTKQMELQNQTKQKELDTKQKELDTKQMELQTKQKELDTKQMEIQTKQKELDTKQMELQTKQMELQNQTKQMELQYLTKQMEIENQTKQKELDTKQMELQYLTKQIELEILKQTTL